MKIFSHKVIQKKNLTNTCKHSSGSVRLTAQCIHVRPFISLSIPSCSAHWYSERQRSSKCFMLSIRQAHMHGVIPSLSLRLGSADFSSSIYQTVAIKKKKEKVWMYLNIYKEAAITLPPLYPSNCATGIHENNFKMSFHNSFSIKIQ